ncbi:DinB family protein [Nocardioides jishulii]|nr:DinB family protein [Nocardioides jishulii]
MSDMWTDPATDPREQLPPAHGEKATLGQYLEAYRMTLEMKCEGLDAAQMATRAVPPSDLSLLGMVQHLARVEHRWFRCVLGGAPTTPRLYEDGDGGFADVSPTDEAVEAAWATWRREVDHARTLWEGLEESRLGDEFDTGGGGVTARDLAVHMVEEYARHMGHVDLLRECLDGRTGQ